jgi:hypothetical protein
VSIAASTAAESTTQAGALVEIEKGQSQLAELVACDERFAALVAQHGLAPCEYVDFFGMGGFTIATVEQDGSVYWNEWIPPHS